MSHAQVSTTASISERLSVAGCVAADEEAAALVERGRGDEQYLEAIVQRRTEGVPLAWLVGSTTFAGLEILVDEGVYVPRWQSEPLAIEAAGYLEPGQVAVELCCGTGAIAAVLNHRQPTARVLGTDLDPRAVHCARRNGIEAYLGDLADPLPAEHRGQVQVVVAVPPYVPTDALRLLPRDVVGHEGRLALHGGPDGLAVTRRVLTAAAQLLAPGGWLLVEVGGDQDHLLEAAPQLEHFGAVELRFDEDDDLRAMVAQRRS